MSARGAYSLAPSVCTGTVMHARHSPAAHRFAYPVFYLRLPLGRLDEIHAWPLAIGRRGAVSVRHEDHGARDGSAPMSWIRAVLEGAKVPADGEVVLQTLPRLFGYVFNPVSFWFCHDRAGDLRAVLCEVNNTFGERHNYLVAREDGAPIRSGDELRARKVFHVSPFFPVRGEYRFRFATRGSVHAVAIDYWDGGRKVLTTRLSLRAAPLSTRSLLAALARFPLMTFGVIARIHLQALRLWLKGAPFFRKPLPPLQETTR